MTRVIALAGDKLGSSTEFHASFFWNVTISERVAIMAKKKKARSSVIPESFFKRNVYAINLPKPDPNAKRVCDLSDDEQRKFFDEINGMIESANNQRKEYLRKHHLPENEIEALKIVLNHPEMDICDESEFGEMGIDVIMQLIQSAIARKKWELDFANSISQPIKLTKAGTKAVIPNEIPDGPAPPDKIWIGGKNRVLEPKPHAMIQYMWGQGINHVGEKTALVDHVMSAMWGPNKVPSDRTFDNAKTKVNNALEQLGSSLRLSKSGKFLTLS